MCQRFILRIYSTRLRSVIKQAVGVEGALEWSNRALKAELRLVRWQISGKNSEISGLHQQYA